MEQHVRGIRRLDRPMMTCVGVDVEISRVERKFAGKDEESWRRRAPEWIDLFQTAKVRHCSLR
jgi:hypothetical protein